MCEIMASAVAGGQGAFHEAKGGVLNSMLATVIDLSRLGDPAKIAADIEAVKAHVKSARPAPGFDEVLTPGEPERRYAAQRMVGWASTWTTPRGATSGRRRKALGITAAEFDQAVGANRGA